MWLLDTSSHSVYELSHSETLDYATLSHTWEKQKVSLQMLVDP